MSALPLNPIEGVTAAYMQTISVLPPAEHDVERTELAMVGCDKSPIPELTTMLALATILTTPFPTDMTKSALTAPESEIFRPVDSSMMWLVKI